MGLLLRRRSRASLRRWTEIGRIVELRLGRIGFVGGLGRDCGRRFGCIALEPGIDRSMVAAHNFVDSRRSAADTVAGNLFDNVAASDCFVGRQSMEVEAFDRDLKGRGSQE